MKWLPKKTVSDISPKTAEQAPTVPDLAPLSSGPQRPRRRFLRVLGLALASIVVAFPLLVLVGYFKLRAEFLNSVDDLKAVTVSGTNGLSDLRALFADNKGLELASKFGPFLELAGRSYRSLQDLALAGFKISEDLNYLENNGLNLSLDGKGEAAIARLASIRDSVGKMYEASAQVPADKDLAAIDLMDLRMTLGRAKDFLDLLVPWLSEDKDRRLVIFFENSAEIRPGGGFLGSYAELTLRKGSLTGIVVRDISDADRKLDLKTIPPKPLQNLVRNWRAADANWFLDFPSSASKTLEFLEASDLYHASGTIFDGAIAVSPRVVSDILAATGPVRLPSGVSLDPDNFLKTLQAEVERGQISGEDSPKQVLSEAAPIILQKLKDLDPASREKLLSRVSDWANKKDARIYFKDRGFENVWNSLGAGGEIKTLAEGWNGDYLAVANANVGGGKTDTVISQKVDWQIQLTSEGLVRTHLVVAREHKAKPSDAWWYRLTNTDFIRIFTPPGSKLTYAQGGRIEKISPKINYNSTDYSIDPQVSALEATRMDLPGFPEMAGYKENGRQVFATWLKIAPGETSTLTLDYEHKVQMPRDGAKYELVFDKQPSSAGNYHFEATAPVGYVFAESNSPVFEYRSSDPPGSLVIPLTLREAQ